MAGCELSSFPLMCMPVSVLADLGLTGLPLSPTMFSAPRKVALDSFSSCFKCTASWMPHHELTSAQVGYRPFKDLCPRPPASWLTYQIPPHWLDPPLLIVIIQTDADSTCEHSELWLLINPLQCGTWSKCSPSPLYSFPQRLEGAHLKQSHSNFPFCPTCFSPWL